MDLDHSPRTLELPKGLSDCEEQGLTLLQTGEGKGVLPNEVILGRHVKVFHHKPDQGKCRDLYVKCKLFIPVWVKAWETQTRMEVRAVDSKNGGPRCLQIDGDFS